jgi:hypothetical protein
MAYARTNVIRMSSLGAARCSAGARPCCAQHRHARARAARAAADGPAGVRRTTRRSECAPHGGMRADTCARRSRARYTARNGPSRNHTGCGMVGACRGVCARACPCVRARAAACACARVCTQALSAQEPLLRRASAIADDVARLEADRSCCLALQQATAPFVRAYRGRHGRNQRRAGGATGRRVRRPRTRAPRTSLNLATCSQSGARRWHTRARAAALHARRSSARACAVRQAAQLDAAPLRPALTAARADAPATRCRRAAAASRRARPRCNVAKTPGLNPVAPPWGGSPVAPPWGGSPVAPSWGDPVATLCAGTSRGLSARIVPALSRAGSRGGAGIWLVVQPV